MHGVSIFLFLVNAIYKAKLVRNNEECVCLRGLDSKSKQPLSVSEIKKNAFRQQKTATNKLMSGYFFLKSALPQTADRSGGKQDTLDAPPLPPLLP